MNVSSEGRSRQHHYTTKSITIPYVPNGKYLDRVGAGKGNFSTEVFQYATMSPTKARGIGTTNADAFKGGERRIGVL